MSFQSTVLALSPYAFLPLADTSGTAATDISGNSRAGLYQSSPTLNQTGFTSDGSASILCSNSGRVQLAGGPGLQSSTAFTLGFIVSPAALNSGSYLCGGGNAGFLGNSWLVTIDTSNIHLRINSTDNTATLASAGIAGNGGPVILWIDYDGATTWHLYVNGSSTAAITVTGQTFTIPSTPRLQVANFSDQVGAGQIGYYQYVMQFSSVLSSANRSSIYSAAGLAATLVAGTLTITSGTNQIGVSTTSATGGVAPYTYQVIRSHVPSTSNSGFTQVYSGTATTYNDTPSDTRLYYYRYLVTDSNTPARTVQTAMRPGQLRPAVLIGAIGNSRTAGTTVSAGQDPVTQLARILSEEVHPCTVSFVNQGVGGSTTTDWLPNSTNLNAAISAFSSAASALPTGSAFYIQIALGVNDGRVDFHITLAQWKSNILSIVSALKAANFSKFKGVVLHCDYYCVPFGFNVFYDENTLGLMQSYNESIPSLVDNTTILQGDMKADGYFAVNAATALSDQLHATAAGCISLADMWAQSYSKILNPSPPARNVTFFRR